MRVREFDFTPTGFRIGEGGAEEKIVTAMARRPWLYLLATLALGRTYERLVDRQARRELARRPRVWNPITR